MENDLGAAFEPVRGEMSRLQQDTGKMREEIELLSLAADRAGRSLEASLLRAVKTGKFGFEDLGRIALSVLDQIAQAAIRKGIDRIFHGGGAGAGGLVSAASSIFNTFGLPGRATGGPVSPGRAYLVGERGPEVFMPTSSGQVLPGTGGQGGGRDVRVSITVNGGGQEAPRALARSARQVARAVRGALGD